MLIWLVEEDVVVAAVQQISSFIALDDVFIAGDHDIGSLVFLQIVGDSNILVTGDVDPILH